tara:strand:+ start:272 stop:466 length:195 start_codon:yes stop_codon:yes gene_type:complete
MTDSSNNNQGHQKSPLTRLYERQQPKLGINQRQTALLKTFAEDDYKRIAQLIQKWLDDSSSSKK